MLRTVEVGKDVWVIDDCKPIKGKLDSTDAGDRNCHYFIVHTTDDDEYLWYEPEHVFESRKEAYIGLLEILDAKIENLEKYRDRVRKNMEDDDDN